jgi:hypothetical protein
MAIRVRHIPNDNDTLGEFLLCEVSVHPVRWSGVKSLPGVSRAGHDGAGTAWFQTRREEAFTARGYGVRLNSTFTSVPK